ncbi:MAG: hypothetical protein BJ554DRAFT_5816 [Olpidium bornovanus]|uniref:PAS domain S-box protein n=1 Tax=Olpidium bornovanus TaxID=278681 RepID=A0A8H7ZYY8_9FUNG|nr:MAG: hypothetical protein BJ554DRAFT_5816 [Olpidium bornovanus]
MESSLPQLHGVGEMPLTSKEWPSYYRLFCADGVTPLPEDHIPLLRAFRGEHVKDDLIVVESRNGRRTRLLCSGRAMYGKEGRKLGAVVVMRDMLREEAQEALQATEGKYQSLLQSINDALLATKTSGQIITWNAGAERIFGRSTEGALRLQFVDLLPKRLRAAHEERLAAHARDDTGPEFGRTIESVGCRVDGTEFPIEMSITTWEQSGTLYFAYIIRDISDRKRIEAVLEETRRKAENARQFAESVTTLVPNNIYIFDLRYMRCEYMNRSSMEFFGVSEGQTKNLDQSTLSFLHPDSHRAEYSTMADGSFLEFTLQIKHAGGELRWALFREGVFQRGENGEPIQIIGVMQDITALKQAEEELLKSKENLEKRVTERTAEVLQLAESIPIIVWQARADGKQVYLK